MNNTDKVWLITGSSTGLGRALAQAVLERGYRLVATARQPEQLKDLSDRYPDRVTTIAIDVTHILHQYSSTILNLAIKASNVYKTFLRNRSRAIFRS
jgi:NADP-dependent 3-hydroxy acid dehydrogenase YdfG